MRYTEEWWDGYADCISDLNNLNETRFKDKDLKLFRTIQHICDYLISDRGIDAEVTLEKIYKDQEEGSEDLRLNAGCSRNR